MMGGKFGYPVQESLEILVGLGDCYEAERMISVNSSHLLYSFGRLGEGGVLFVHEIAEKGGKFAIFSDVHPSNIDLSQRDFGVCEKYVQKTKPTDQRLYENGCFSLGYLHTLLNRPCPSSERTRGMERIVTGNFCELCSWSSNQ